MPDFKKQARIASANETRYKVWLLNAIILISEYRGESLRDMEDYITREIGISKTLYRDFIKIVVE